MHVPNRSVNNGQNLTNSHDDNNNNNNSGSYSVNNNGMFKSYSPAMYMNGQGVLLLPNGMVQPPLLGGDQAAFYVDSNNTLQANHNHNNNNHNNNHNNGKFNNNNNNNNNNNCSGSCPSNNYSVTSMNQPSNFVPYAYHPNGMNLMTGNPMFSPMYPPSSPPLSGAPTGDFEVHDNQLKAPITVSANDVIPTAGSTRLFQSGVNHIVYGSKNMFRICDSFQQGRCGQSSCPDVHVNPDYLSRTRLLLSTWLLQKEAEFNHDFANNPDKLFKIFVADVKEIVDVPIRSLVFTKGLYVDPSTRFKRTRGVAPTHNAAIAAQVPTGCGLYSMDPSQCKWGRWCNQVHIHPDWMKRKKTEFEQWFEEIEASYLQLPLDHLFTVHDPQLKTSLQIPKWSIVGFSRGLFQGSNRKAPSICLLFQKNRCTAGTCCNQIHVSPVYLSLVRSVAPQLVQGQLPPDLDPDTTAKLATLRSTLSLIHAEEEARRAKAQQNKSTPKVEEEEKGPSEEPPGESGDALFEHIDVEEDDGDMDVFSGPLITVANTSTSSSKWHPGGSCTNHPYISITDLRFSTGADGTTASLLQASITSPTGSSRVTYAVGSTSDTTLRRRTPEDATTDKKPTVNSPTSNLTFHFEAVTVDRPSVTYEKGDREVDATTVEATTGDFLYTI